MRIEAFFYDDENHRDLLAIGEYHPECLGSRDWLGQQIEPNYPESIEVIEVSTKDGDEVEWSDSLWEMAENALWDALPDKN